MAKTIGISIVVILILLYGLSVIGGILYFKKGWFKKFYHDVLKWHRPNDETIGFNGMTFHSTCKHCGEKIMQDSQGNWF